MFFKNQNSLELLTSSKRVNLWLQNEWSLATVECSSTTGQLKTSTLLFERSDGRKTVLKKNEVFTPNMAPYEKPRTVSDRGESGLSNDIKLVALHSRLKYDPDRDLPVELLMCKIIIIF